MTDTHHLTPAEVAKRFSRKPRTVRNWIATGRLKAKRDLATKSLYVELAEVERFERDVLADYDATRDQARRPPRAPEAATAAAPAPAPAPSPGVIPYPGGGRAKDEPAPAPKKSLTFLG